MKENLRLRKELEEGKKENLLLGLCWLPGRSAAIILFLPCAGSLTVLLAFHMAFGYTEFKYR